jgi:hypothetical protein
MSPRPEPPLRSPTAAGTEEEAALRKYLIAVRELLQRLRSLSAVDSVEDLALYLFER